MLRVSLFAVRTSTMLCAEARVASARVMIGSCMMAVKFGLESEGEEEDEDAAC